MYAAHSINPVYAAYSINPVYAAYSMNPVYAAYSINSTQLIHYLGLGLGKAQLTKRRCSKNNRRVR